jgi:pyrimidine 5'-nucleotidase
MRYTTLLVDLDETVYPPSSGVWDAISRRMEQYMHERMQFSQAEIPHIRTQLYQQYGTTLRGLQVTYQVDEREFIEFVHDIPVDDLLQPDPLLRQVLMQYPQRKYIFTNADRKHASRVIQRLGLADCFDGIIDIYDIAPFCKPMPEAYQAAIRLSGETHPERCVFIDDSPRNLAGAMAQGIYTIQVGKPKPGFTHPESAAHARIDHLHNLPEVLPPDLPDGKD